MAYNSFNSYGFSYNQADANKDGVLDRNEFRNYRDFLRADRNQNGVVGLVEFASIAGRSLVI